MRSCIHIYIYIYAYIYIYIYIHICIYVCVCVRVRLVSDTYTYMCVYMYIYTPTHTHSLSPSLYICIELPSGLGALGHYGLGVGHGAFCLEALGALAREGALVGFDGTSKCFCFVK